MLAQLDLDRLHPTGAAEALSFDMRCVGNSRLELLRQHLDEDAEVSRVCANRRREELEILPPDGGLDRRELAGQPVDVELVDPLGPVEILELVLAEIAEGDPVQLVVEENGCGRLRGEHLGSMAGGHDPRGPVHADPVVAPLLGYDGLACVHAHPHTQLGTVGPCVRGEATAASWARGKT